MKLVHGRCLLVKRQQTPAAIEPFHHSERWRAKLGANQRGEVRTAAWHNFRIKLAINPFNTLLLGTMCHNMKRLFYFVG